MVPPLLQHSLNANAIDNANASGACVCVCVQFFETQPGVWEIANVYNKAIIYHVI